MAANPRHAEQETAEAGREWTKRAFDQTAQTSRTMADAAERTARAGAEAVRRNADSITSHWQRCSDGAGRIMERSMSQVSKIWGLGDGATQTVQQSASNLQSVIDSSTIIGSGLQGISEEWMRFAQDRVEDNLERVDEMMACRSIQDCLALQAQLVRDNFEALLQSARRTSELSTRMADQAVSKMTNSTLAPR